MNPNLKASDGFTLVELLVSLALLSLMAIYALNALSSLKNINRVVDRTEAQMEVDAVARHLRDAIADIRPVFVTNEKNTQHLMFKGSTNSLEFVGAANGDQETGGLYLLHYSVNAEHEMIVERTMWRGKPETAASKVVLMRHIKGVIFKYEPPLVSAGVGETSGSWEQRDVLPTFIGVNVTFESDDPRNWPITFVNLKTAQ
jgi:general secretion pathway protein J